MKSMFNETKEGKFRENPNPKAKIGFVIFYPFQFYVFKNIYKHLTDEAEFIVDLGKAYPLKVPQGLPEDCISLLLKHGVSFRVFSYEHYKSEELAIQFLSGYKVLVALWQAGCIALPSARNVRKVHINYGGGKELTMFWTRHRNWDLYLCPGPRVYRIIQYLTWAEIVGYPKFDDWFNDQLDEGLVAKIESRLDPQKKTILYLPTHSDLCSIDDLADELKKLSATYNVVVKVHYYTPREEPERMMKLVHPGIHLFADETDLLPLLRVSDVIVSDNSSAIFDAILADKPVVVTDFLSKKYLDDEHKNIRQFNFRMAEGAVTYSQSIEQKIKKDGSVITIKNPGELRNGILLALADGRQFSDVRKRLREEIFAFNDGKCGERAAHAIQKLLSLEQLPEKPILYHVIEAEQRTFRHKLEILEGVGLGDSTSEYYYHKALGHIKSLPLIERIRVVLKEFFL